MLALPGAGGGPVSVLLEAFFGEMLVLSTSSTPDRLGDSGLHEDALAIADLGPGYTRIVLTPMADGVPLGRDALWIDDAVFEPVPEPGTALLVGLSLAAIAAQRRAGSCAAQRRAGS